MTGPGCRPATDTAGSKGRAGGEGQRADGKAGSDGGKGEAKKKTDTGACRGGGVMRGRVSTSETAAPCPARQLLRRWRACHLGEVNVFIIFERVLPMSPRRGFWLPMSLQRGCCLYHLGEDAAYVTWESMASL